jgi:sulfatase maturation enzyme AslB (radical SAM superfamily)
MTLKKLVVELTSLCNLNCEYCFKALGTSHLDIRLLERILLEARSWGASQITYTGGEATLYPKFDEAVQLAQGLGYRYALVTNGWHFPRTLPLLKNSRQALNHIFFSLDSVVEALHDRVRGNGSFQRIMAAADLCRTNDLPFSFLVVLNQKNVHELEGLCLLASSVGAAGVRFGHLLPTSEDHDTRLSLSNERRRAAEAEVERLNASLPISISFSASATNDAAGACCEAFAGHSISVDCHGRLSLCCQLVEYRGAASGNDVVADLNTVDFANAYAKFLARAFAQRNRRDQALAAGVALAASPCDFCVAAMDKTPWRKELVSGGVRDKL